MFRACSRASFLKLPSHIYFSCLSPIAMIHGLHAVLTAVWQSVTIPPEWKRELVVPIWKRERGPPGLQQLQWYYAVDCARQGPCLPLMREGRAFLSFSLKGLSRSVEASIPSKLARACRGRTYDYPGTITKDSANHVYLRVYAFK